MDHLQTQSISLPRLGLGTYRMQGDACRAAVESALALGYRHIDAAEMYANEEAIGAIASSGVLPRSDARKVAVKRVKGAPVRTELVSAERHDGRLARAHGEKPRGAARARLAHRHSNPLNAQAMDTRIQKWPCNPDNGGICAWQ